MRNKRNTNTKLETNRGRVSRHDVRSEPLQTASSHLVEVAVQDADIEKCRRVDQLEELDVVAAVQSRVDANCKLHVFRLADSGTQLLYLSASSSTHTSFCCQTTFHS